MSAYRAVHPAHALSVLRCSMNKRSARRVARGRCGSARSRNPEAVSMAVAAYGRRRTGRPTLEDVAARAGVGRGTASRVINGSPRVRPATREAVERAVAELGYVPNRAARALAANRTDALALVIPEPETRLFAEPYFSGIIRGVSAELAATDIPVAAHPDRHAPGAPQAGPVPHRAPRRRRPAALGARRRPAPRPAGAARPACGAQRPSHRPRAHAVRRLRQRRRRPGRHRAPPRHRPPHHRHHHRAAGHVRRPLPPGRLPPGPGRRGPPPPGPTPDRPRRLHRGGRPARHGRSAGPQPRLWTRCSPPPM